MKRLLFLFFILLIPSFLKSVIVEYKWPYSAPQYHIIIATNSVFSFPVADDIINTTNYIIDLEPGHYYLKIAPILKGIEGFFSEPVDFSVSGDGIGGKGKLTGVKSPALIEEEPPSGTNILKWDCIISSNSPVNLNSILYYSVDTPADFKEARGLQISIDTSLLDEGYHNLFYRLINPLGKESKILSVKFIVEHNPPILEILPDRFIVFGDKIYLYPGSRINYSCYDKWSACSCYFGINQRKVEGQFYTVTTDTNILKAVLYARNDMNYESRMVKTFYVDTEPPIIKLYLNKKEISNTVSSYGDSVINLKITVNTRMLQFYTILDGITNKNMPMSWRYLRTGSHSLKIIAFDIFENRSEQTWKIEVSEGKPVVTWTIYPVEENNEN